MSKFYTFYATELAPQELLEKFPKARTYADGLVIVFAESYEQVTGQQPTHLIDLSLVPITNQELSVDGITTEELEAKILGFVELIKSGTATGSELRLSKEQGLILFNGVFKDDGSESEA